MFVALLNQKCQTKFTRMYFKKCKVEMSNFVSNPPPGRRMKILRRWGGAILKVSLEVDLRFLPTSIRDFPCFTFKMVALEFHA